MIEVLQNWIPYKITDIANEPLCCWLNTFNKPFNEPFFEQTIMVCKGLSGNYPAFQSVSDLNVLPAWSQNIDYLAPTAFIFHLSRCGSTLVSQLLGVDAQSIFLAEVPFFDDILRLPYKNPNHDPASVEHLFTAALKFYGQRRNGNETKLFVKTDSWHILFFDILRSIYPTTPFVLLYRSPDEVLNSHAKLRGIQAVPGLIEPGLFGFGRDETGAMPFDVYTVKVLEHYLSEFIRISKTDTNTLLLNYNEGIMTIIEKIAAFSHITIASTELAKMKERSSYHSKYPGQLFAEEQPIPLPEYIRSAMKLYKQLDGIRAFE